MISFLNYMNIMENYRIQFWDLSSCDRNFMIAKVFAKGAQGAVVMWDSTNISTREQ